MLIAGTSVVTQILALLTNSLTDGWSFWVAVLLIGFTAVAIAIDLLLHAPAPDRTATSPAGPTGPTSGPDATDEGASAGEPGPTPVIEKPAPPPAPVGLQLLSSLVLVFGWVFEHIVGPILYALGWMLTLLVNLARRAAWEKGREREATEAAKAAAADEAPHPGSGSGRPAAAAADAGPAPAVRTSPPPIGPRDSRPAYLRRGGAFVVVVLAAWLIGAKLPSGQPVRQVVLTDDFSTSAAGWTEASGSLGSARRDAGRGLVLSSERGERVTSEPKNGALDLSDVAVEADAVLRSGDDAGYFGLTCRLQRRPATLSYYAFVVRGDGYAAIMKQTKSGELQLLTAWTAPPGLRLSSANRLSAQCRTTAANTVTLALRINGHTVDTAYDTDPTGDGSLLLQGTVGVLAVSGDKEKLAADFDNVAVSTAE